MLSTSGGFGENVARRLDLEALDGKIVSCLQRDVLADLRFADMGVAAFLHYIWQQ